MRETRGFTLIEILLVLAIVAMVMSLGLPAIERVTNQRVNSSARKFVGLIRTVRNDSVLLNNIYRLAIDFEKKTWWVESQREFKLLSEQEPPPDPKRKKEDAPVSNFTYAEKYSAKPTPMPGGVIFSGVFKEREGLIKEGVAYVHFFPNGFNEQAILYLAKEGSDIGYSLVIRPASGRVELLSGFVKDFNTSTDRK